MKKIMKRSKLVMAFVLTIAMIANVFLPAGSITAQAAVKTKKYVVSNASGTYYSAITVKVKAKKGYKVYYTLGTAKFKPGKVIESGDSLKFDIEKTTSLRLIAVKKNKHYTRKTLNSKKTAKKIKSFVYAIEIDEAPGAVVTPNTVTPSAYYTVNFITNGGSNVSVQTVASGATVVRPSDPTKSGFVFAGWYTDSTLTKAYNFKNPVYSNLILYAKWTVPASASGSSGSGSSGAGGSGSNNSGSGGSGSNGSGNSESNNSGSNESGSSGTGISGSPAISADTSDALTIKTYNVTKPSTSFNITNSSGNTLDASNGVYTIAEGGSYTATGSAEKINIVISAATDVSLCLNNAYIDNSSLTSDEPVIKITDKITADITVSGDNLLKGSSNYSAAPASGIIYQDAKGTINISSKNNGVLVITDSLAVDKAKAADAADKDLTDGISTKGTLNIKNGSLSVTANGSCLKGTNGGVKVTGGDLSLISTLSNGIKSKSSTVNITGGKVCIEADGDDGISSYDKKNITTSNGISIAGGELTVATSGGDGLCSTMIDITGGSNYIMNTAGDGLRAKSGTTVDADAKTSNTVSDGTGSITISGGITTISECGGDGIQGENVNISSGTVTIETAYENAATQYYNTSSASGSYKNSIVTVGNGGTGTVKTETVTYDTGSHTGIKAGTKEKTFTYKSVENDSPYTAGVTYNQSASGSLIISGGTVNINTTATGIKYNAGNDSQVIIGSPDDGIQGNNTVNISGGTVNIWSSDDGISAGKDISITGNATVFVNTAYEGMESPAVTIGTKDSQSGPTVSVYTNDDGINASGKTSVYIYDDEDEEKYVKTTTSKSGNTVTVYSGYLNVMIGDDTTHTANLKSFDGTTYNKTYSSMGDGIDCNGSFYAYGGTTVVYGMSSGSESPIDMDGEFVISDGATLFLVGCDEMGETSSAKSTTQPILIFGSSGRSGGIGGIGGIGSQVKGSSTTTLTLAANTAIGILDANSNVLEAAALPKSASFIMLASPSLTSGSTYSLYTGGVVANTKMTGVIYDRRYKSYSGGSQKTTATAATSSGSSNVNIPGIPGGNSGDTPAIPGFGNN